MAGDHRVGAGYESRYVTEGRDNLMSGGIGVISYEFSAPLSVGLWHAVALSESYSESQVSLAVAHAFDDSLEMALTWTLVSATTQGHRDSDHELGGTLAFTQGAFATVMDAVWSHQERNGWLHIEQSVDVMSGVSLFLGVGFNGGYVPGESKGLNHGVIGARGEKSVAERLGVSWSLAHSRALRENPGDTTNDETWGSVSLSYTF